VRPAEPAGPAAGALERFAHDLRELRDRNERPTYRKLQQLTGYSRTTIASAFVGDRLPPWELVRQLVHELGGDEDEWHRKWDLAYQQRKGRP